MIYAFIVILFSFFGLSFYVFIRGLQALPPFLWLKIIYSVIFIGSMAAFFVKMFLGDNMRQSAGTVLSAVGFTWMIALVYFAIFILGVDIIRLINRIFDIYPLYIKENYQLVKTLLFVFGIVVVTSVLAYGNYKFNNPVITTLDLTTHKPLPGGKLKLVVASDIHLSSYINKKDLKKYVELINTQKGDVILLAGDIADRDPHPLINQNMKEELGKLYAPRGVFAITGNHEFYGRKREEIYNYIKSSGITFLKDSVALVDSAFYIAGRDDITNSGRISLDTLLRNTDKSLPVILLDHQPRNLEDAAKNGVDLQFSGHTHNGQFWPGNILVKLFFKHSYGYLRIGDTQYFVTSGLGLWGPKYRIGTKSEIVVINMISDK
ncbi:MAG TPA: metallophosphoesterase [Bacteroidales bacterium]|nr:metallophosphoesterase [Bacteroidales bacterium]